MGAKEEGGVKSCRLAYVICTALTFFTDRVHLIFPVIGEPLSLSKIAATVANQLTQINNLVSER